MLYYILLNYVCIYIQALDFEIWLYLQSQQCFLLLCKFPPLSVVGKWNILVGWPDFQGLCYLQGEYILNHVDMQWGLNELLVKHTSHQRFILTSGHSEGIVTGWCHHTDTVWNSLWHARYRQRGNGSSMHPLKKKNSHIAYHEDKASRRTSKNPKYPKVLCLMNKI